MRILVTGGTGFIGQALINRLLDEGEEVICLSRERAKVARRFADRVRGVAALAELADEPLDAVINLAGAPIADRRWSAARKQLLRDSRLQLTGQLIDWLAQRSQRPAVLISGSAIGYYGAQQGDTQLDENGKYCDGFTHRLCADWEAAAQRAESLGVRVCLIRTGVVLGPGGGALSKMLPPFRFGLGGRVGHGRQWFSWVHLQDEVAAILFLLRNETLAGPFNLTAPDAVRNEQFSQALGRVLKRPVWLPVPPLMVKLMLGEGAELLLEGQRVYPARLLDAGFQFHYPQLDAALQEVFH
ncbi:TIGR01777 family oxidoreductase [Marinobacterium arenosum]|uniref:TIGR01777 family oxidoreductase n=1 Tax=Marinobacterium arenosum TaxID=2862496 RepID=UPI001C9717F0|nr:TIGR01777 family oxidoreductase [Marinobacterium arenosum]MBY4677993.1 TIGR01777 family oxidoreductase [Marinobacterium arenosum]